MKKPDAYHMAHTVSAETWEKLRTLAAAAGQDLKQYIEDLLRQHAQNTPSTR